MNLLNYLIKKGFTQENIEKFIIKNKILVNNQITHDLKMIINPNDKVEILPQKTWVSRGAYKLLKAIEEFKINLKNKIILDIGASTGGFTDVALNYGAKKVYALDVGTNQLEYKLRVNPKVVVLEKTNLKNIIPQMFSEKIDFVVCDVSFISLKKVFEVLKIISHKNLKIIALIKPQFEAKKTVVEKGGYVNQKYHLAIIENINNFAIEQGFYNTKITKSPILGKKSKNIEYIGYYKVL